MPLLWAVIQNHGWLHLAEVRRLSFSLPLQLKFVPNGDSIRKQAAELYKVGSWAWDIWSEYKGLKETVQQSMHAHAGEGVPRRLEAGVGVGGLLLETQLIAFDWISAGLACSPP
jgi:hypothetical protein